MKKLLIFTILSVSSILSSSFAKDSTEIKFEIFEQVASLKCEIYNQGISKTKAYSLTTLVINKTVDLELYKKSFNKSCNYDEAVAIGSDKEFGEKRFEALEQIIFLNCDANTHYMTLENSSILAQAAARGLVNLKTFIKAYKLSCDYDISASLATIEQNMSLSGVASVDVSATLMNDTRREPALVKTFQGQSLQSAPSTTSAK